MKAVERRALPARALPGGKGEMEGPSAHSPTRQWRHCSLQPAIGRNAAWVYHMVEARSALRTLQPHSRSVLHTTTCYRGQPRARAGLADRWVLPGDRCNGGLPMRMSGAAAEFFVDGLLLLPRRSDQVRDRWVHSSPGTQVVSITCASCERPESPGNRAWRNPFRPAFYCLAGFRPSF